MNKINIIQRGRNIKQELIRVSGSIALIMKVIDIHTKDDNCYLKGIDDFILNTSELGQIEDLINNIDTFIGGLRVPSMKTMETRHLYNKDGEWIFRGNSYEECLEFHRNMYLSGRFIKSRLDKCYIKKNILI